MRKGCNLLLAATGLLLIHALALASGLDGRWDAQLTNQGTVIPFRLDIAIEGDQVTGTLFNGDRPQTTTSAKIENGQVTLEYAHYLTKIIASEKDGVLTGKVEGRFNVGGSYISAVPFEARRHQPVKASFANVPTVDGLWEIPYESAKGEKAWRFIVKQNGPEAAASILRVDGDTGSLTGRWDGEKFVLSHFDGSRPMRLEVTPQADGTLALSQGGGIRAGKYKAIRPEVARAQGLPEPANFVKHTTLRDPSEKFSFQFPDLDGKPVSIDDPKFKDKVLVAIVTGTWCPNCHDEAQYLVKLYEQYRDRGLEIVALDFEEPEQQDDLARPKAFVKKYGVKYTYLLAGAPAEMWEKVPQAVNLNTWPATFFIAKDRTVRRIHAGFAAPASGKFHEELKAEFTSTIEQLLAEKSQTAAAESAALRD